MVTKRNQPKNTWGREEKGQEKVGHEYTFC